jgi:hypothetical protein
MRGFGGCGEDRGRFGGRPIRSVDGRLSWNGVLPVLFPNGVSATVLEDRFQRDEDGFFMWIALTLDKDPTGGSFKYPSLRRNGGPFPGTLKALITIIIHLLGLAPAGYLTASDNGA